MNILLWIALIGVIVFLLGLLYSKITDNSAKPSPQKTIFPADTLPSPVIKPHATPDLKKNDDPETQIVATHTFPTTSPQKIMEQTVSGKKASTAEEKTIPAAEPVGPGNSKPNTTVKTTAPKASTPSQPSEPKRLTKPHGGKADDLTQITGIGKSIQNKLFNAGIYHYSQLTDLNAVQTEWLNKTIGFSGRAERENWALQAQKLALKSTTPAPTPANRGSKTPTAKIKAKTAAKQKPKATK